jgi:hypothetical protein
MAPSPARRPHAPIGSLPSPLTSTAGAAHHPAPPPPGQGKYVSLGMMRTGRDWITASIVLAVLGVLLGGNSAYKGVSTARTNSRRKKALASLEKDE